MVVKKMKRTKPNNKVGSRCNIKSLPKDLLTNVLALVASGSVTDLFNVKRSCKDLLEKRQGFFVLETLQRERKRRGSIQTRHVGVLFFVGNRIRTRALAKSRS
ncbi:hypothetical protein QYF36_016424 [Acer negundo]|nr:hypothetical protein QYF36_016424 [Acer negundo]